MPAKKSLNLKVLDSATLLKGINLKFNDKGLTSVKPFRNAYDGITYFGCKKSVPANEEFYINVQ